MKKVILILSALSCVGSFAVTKTITEGKAQSLLQALFQSGVEIVDTQTGFKLLEPSSIACRGSREHEYSGGLLSLAPECFKAKNQQASNFFNFDQKLTNTVSLEKALDAAGADADAAMGTHYISANNIMCEFTSSPRQTVCTFEVSY